MSVLQKDNSFPFPKLEVRIGNYLMKTLNNNEVIFKDNRNGKTHYSAYFDESSVGFLKTLEGQHPKHIPIAKADVDWRSFGESIVFGIRADWKTIFQSVNVYDPKWANLEVDYLPVQLLKELLPPTRKGTLLLNEEYIEKFLNSLEVSRLKDLAERGFWFGAGSGYFVVLNNGDKGFLLDTNRFSEIFSKGLKSSIRNVRLKHLT